MSKKLFPGHIERLFAFGIVMLAGMTLLLLVIQANALTSSLEREARALQNTTPAAVIEADAQ